MNKTRIGMMMAGVLAFVGCGTESDFGASEELLSDAAASEGLLAFVNNPATDVRTLDIYVAIDARAAQNIVARRNGPDATAWTADDKPYGSIEELDAVPYVGTVTLDKLLAFAKSLGFVQQTAGTYDSVFFSAHEAEAGVDIANRAAPEQLKAQGLDARQVQNLTAARPLANLAQLAAVPYIGTAAMGHVKGFVAKWEGGEESLGQGALFDGVPFGAADITLALDAANRATADELVTLGAIGAYHAQLIATFRPYAALAEVSNLRAINANTMERLLALARSGKWALPPPPPAQLTQDQALVKGREALSKYFHEDFVKQTVWCEYWCQDAAKWIPFFEDQIAKFGTDANPLQEVIVKADAFTFVGDLDNLYTEVTISLTGETGFVLIEVD